MTYNKVIWLYLIENQTMGSQYDPRSRGFTKTIPGSRTCSSSLGIGLVQERGDEARESGEIRPNPGASAKDRSAPACLASFPSRPKQPPTSGPHCRRCHRRQLGHRQTWPAMYHRQRHQPRQDRSRQLPQSLLCGTNVPDSHASPAVYK